MPSRTARQQRRRTGRTQPTSYNGIDAYGTLKAGEHEFKARLIEYAENTFAAFNAQDPQDPLLFTVEAYTVKGRMLTAQVAEGEPIRFQKAGCGCETPHNLRGSRGRLMEAAPAFQTELAP